MNKLLNSSIILVCLLSNCSNYLMDDYSSINPYIKVEKVNDLYKLKECNVSTYIKMMEEGKSFICLLYSSSCSYCEKEIENILIPYIEETSNCIYGLDVFYEDNYFLLRNIEKYQPLDNSYFHNQEEITVSRPTLQVINNGEVICYEVGYSYSSRRMLDSYILK